MSLHLKNSASWETLMTQRIVSMLLRSCRADDWGMVTLVCVFIYLQNWMLRNTLVPKNWARYHTKQCISLSQCRLVILYGLRANRFFPKCFQGYLNITTIASICARCHNWGPRRRELLRIALSITVSSIDTTLLPQSLQSNFYGPVANQQGKPWRP